MTTLAVVGGFLGAGKTTLLLAAGAVLRQRGLRAGIVTNDQGGALVDTRVAEAAGFPVGEVAGGCFCCRFSGLLSAADRLVNADIIFAEPVGSCTDLSATILQPLKRWHRARFHLAPFTVLVDPARARELLAGNSDPDEAFLFRNQLLEADLVAFSKADLHDELPDLPGIAALRLSAATGEGIAGWLDAILDRARPSGTRLLALDYGRYATAEASLGWLDWEGVVRTRRALTPASVVGPLVHALDSALAGAGVRIAHLKVFGQAETGYVKASVCRGGGEPGIDGALDAAPARVHTVLVNLRAAAPPERLLGIADEVVAALPGKVAVRRREAFRPAAPRPEHRFSSPAADEGIAAPDADGVQPS